MRRFWLALAALLLLGAGRAEAKWQSVLQTVIASGGGGGAVGLNWSNAAAANFSSISTVAIGKDFPAGSCGTFTAGNFLIAQVSLWTNGGAAPGAISTPTGWTAGGSGSASSDTQFAWFYKIATGSESCATGFSASWTNATQFVAWSLIDLNSTGAGPTLDVAGTYSAGTTGAGTAITASSVTTTVAADILVWLAGTDGAKGPYTVPSGFTSVVNTTNNAAVMVAYKTLSSTGATGAVSGASNLTFATYGTVLVAVKP